MGKYLHKYYNEDDFQTDYGKLTVTAFTTPSSGTFVYDRYDYIEEWDTWNYIWKNGNLEATTGYYRIPSIGPGEAYCPSTGDELEVTAVLRGKVAKNYREPWVSVTERKFIEIDGDEFEYAGEVDVAYYPQS